MNGLLALLLLGAILVPPLALLGWAVWAWRRWDRAWRSPVSVPAVFAAASLVVLRVGLWGRWDPSGRGTLRLYLIINIVAYVLATVAIVGHARHVLPGPAPSDPGTAD